MKEQGKSNGRTQLLTARNIAHATCADDQHSGQSKSKIDAELLKTSQPRQEGKVTAASKTLQEIIQLATAGAWIGRRSLAENANPVSQSAPGLDCGCRRVGFGRGHGCTARLTKRYFGY